MRILCGFLLVMFCTPWTECRAQSSLFGSGGTSGSSTGSSSNRSASGNSSSSLFGGAALGPTSGTAGRSRTGGNPSGMATSGTSTLGQTRLNAGDGSLGATIGTSAFTGREADSTRFIGSQNASGSARGQSSQQFSLLQGLVSNSQFNQNNTNTTPAQSIVPQLQLGFIPPPVPSAELQTTIQSRLIAVPSLEARSAGVSAWADAQGLVVLTGTVGSEEDGRLIETLVRMEPGVRDVRNELAVRSTRSR